MALFPCNENKSLQEDVLEIVSGIMGNTVIIKCDKVREKGEISHPNYLFMVEKC